MNIYTLLLATWLFAYGFAKLGGTFSSENEPDSETNHESKINYYAIKINRVLEPFVRVADFIIGLSVAIIGIIFFKYGIKGLSIVDAIKTFVN